jgi:hypothetical protein
MWLYPSPRKPFCDVADNTASGMFSWLTNRIQGNITCCLIIVLKMYISNLVSAVTFHRVHSKPKYWKTKTSKSLEARE